VKSLTYIEELLRQEHGEDIFIPQKFVELDTLQKLEKGLRGRDLQLIKRTISSNVEDFLDNDELDEFQSKLNEEDYSTGINDDDEELVDFLAKYSQMDVGYFLRIAVSLSNALDTAEELEDIDTSEYPNVKASAYMWNYIYLFESLLDLITRVLIGYYDSTGNEANSEALRGCLEKGGHLNASDLDQRLNGLPPECNEARFLNKARNLRNSLGHANLHYDSVSDEVVFKKGERKDFQSFVEDFDILLSFSIYWLYRMNGESLDVKEPIEGSIGEVTDIMDQNLTDHRPTFDQKLSSIEEKIDSNSE
jgi:hypothetical protein